MSQTAKRKRRYCSHHDRRQASHRCFRCGAWLCLECTIEHEGRRYCRACRPPDTQGTAAPPPPPLPLAPATPASPDAIDAVSPRIPGWAALALWSVVGLVLVALAFFPLSLREFQALQCAHEQLKQRFADVAAQVSDDSLVNQQLGDELRYVKDSVLTSLAGRHGSHVIDVRIAPILYFDNKLPVSLDDGPTDQRLVCLTFDGGAYANAAGDILDTLRSRGVTATMFLTGRFMENNPDLVRRILAQGHEIGNHTYTHPHLTSWEQNHVQATLPDASRGMLMRELGRTERVYRKITGRDMPALWRAPYGERNRQICQWGQEAGYLHIGWRQGGTWLRNLDSNDWVTEEDDPAYHSPADVYRKIVAAAESGPSGLNGGIILMHLGTTRRDPARQVHRVLGSLIDTLRDMGYQFVKVTDMARAAGVDFALLDHLGDTQALPDRVGAATP